MFTFKRGIFNAVLVLCLLAIDRLTKATALTYLLPGDSVKVFPGFNLTLAFNRGVAFSGFNDVSDGMHLFVVCLIVVISMYVAYRVICATDTFEGGAYSAVLAGAIGNLWDRSALGKIVDFLHFHIKDWHWPIFNFADVFICLGVFGLFVHMFITARNEKVSL